MLQVTRLLLVIGLLVGVGTTPAYAAPAHIATHCGIDADNDTVATTGAIDSTGATLLVIVKVVGFGAHATPTDSKGNTWAALTAYDNGGAAGIIRTFYSIPSSVGGSHTGSTDEAAAYPTLCMMAFSGTHATTPFDQENGDLTTFFASNTIQPGSVTPTQANEVLVTAVAHTNQDFTVNSGFTIPTNGNVGEDLNTSGLYVAYLVQGAAAAVNPTWTTTSGDTNKASNIATFKESAGGGGGPTPHSPCCLGLGVF